MGYFNERITHGAIEAVNAITQLAKRRARGYRNFADLQTIAYWNTGKLKPRSTAFYPLKTAKRHKSYLENFIIRVVDALRTASEPSSSSLFAVRKNYYVINRQT